MKLATKCFLFMSLTFLLLSLSACRAGSGNGLTGGGGGGNNSGGGGGNNTGGGGNTGGPFTIGGTVLGLTGSGLVLELNGGNDLTITAGTGGAAVTFTFGSSITGNYTVIVKTQPSGQTCGVTNGTGTAAANVTTVQVICAPVFTVGGTVTGLLGSGLTLQDNGGDNLVVGGSATVSFTFGTPLLSGKSYAVTILKQPTGPVQTCTVFNGSGTIATSVTNIQITCSQPAFSISGSVVGLVEAAGDTMELQDNAGDNLLVTGDTPFTFATPVTYGGIYRVTMLTPPSSQLQPCVMWFYTGIATTNVSDVLVDCQHNDWTWISWYISSTNGANNYASITTPRFPPNAPPPADLSTPGGRDFAMTWTDNSGRKWLFGGFGLPYPSPYGKQLPGLLNDLWVFESGVWVPANLPLISPPPGSNIWTVDPTPMEAVDAATTASVPGARWGGSTWTDSSGNLWMFGGQGDGSALLDRAFLNDIWEWTPGADDAQGAGTITGTWTFKGGSTAGNQGGTYGSIGTGAATNIPGGRWGAASTTDSSGNAWLFGGQGLDSTGATVGLLNDLWEYTGGQWVWMGPAGTDTANHDGVYGTQNVAATTNVPGGRQGATLWVDASGNVWLFGGFGLDSVGTGATGGNAPPEGSTLNDLWKFDHVTRQWTWISGSTTGNQSGVYGTQATSNLSTGASANVPGSRWGATGWTTPNGDLFLFGGWGYGSIATLPTGFLSDIWEFDQTSQEWIWWKGTSGVNQSGAYLSTGGLPYVNNVVGGRRGTAIWQPDPDGYVWMFGGEGYDSSAGKPPGFLNDFWTYLPFP